MAKSKGGSDKKSVIIVKRGEGGHQAHHGGSWKVAYADFVTAMMALFLLLWLLATLKPSQKEQLALVFQDKKADNPSKDMVAPKLPTYVAKDMLKGYPQFKLSQDNKLKYEIALMIKELVAADSKVKANSGISTDNQGVLLHVNSSVMFQPNTAQLLPEAQKVLDDVIKVMRDHKIDLTIRGHVDDSENGGHLYPSKWELSAARAAAAARYVTEKGAIPPTRVQATGYGDSRPLVPPTTPENRAQNRRVEFYYQSPDTKAN